MTDPVLIIGAGVAGLSAATALRRAGKACIVVEASNRIGGRAHTSLIGDHAFDHGASWLHAADRNPLADIARAQGDTLLDMEDSRIRRVLVDGKPADAEALEARARAYEAFERTAEAEPRDIALADAIDSLRHDPWTASIEGFEACQIAAADPRDFSVHDWKANALEGRNLNIPGGLGAFVLRRLAPPAGPITLNTPVTALDWSGPITAQTASGTIRASACIITVSIGALAKIRFSPELPVSLEFLPMGLLTKVALRANGPDRLGLAANESVSAQIQRGDPMLSVFAWPGGADHMVAFIGGPPAWALSNEGEAATIDYVRGRLRDWFGSQVDRAVGPALVADWARDPWHGGAYAYARPGHAGDRALLGRPLADNRLIIAGEATASDGLAGTVGGAWNEGQRAAQVVMEATKQQTPSLRD